MFNQSLTNRQLSQLQVQIKHFIQMDIIKQNMGLNKKIGYDIIIGGEI